MSDPVLLQTLLTEPLQLLLPLADPVPEDDEVRAGWVALALFAGMAVAVVVLAFSLVKQLGKAERAKRSGVYGDEPTAERSGDTPPADED